MNIKNNNKQKKPQDKMSMPGSLTGRAAELGSVDGLHHEIHY